MTTKRCTSSTLTPWPTPEGQNADHPTWCWAILRAEPSNLLRGWWVHSRTSPLCLLLIDKLHLRQLANFGFMMLWKTYWHLLQKNQYINNHHCTWFQSNISWHWHIFRHRWCRSNSTCNRHTWRHGERGRLLKHSTANDRHFWASFRSLDRIHKGKCSD